MMADVETSMTTVSLASTTRALWALAHQTDPSFFATLASTQERAEYEAIATRFLRLAAAG